MITDFSKPIKITPKSHRFFQEMITAQAAIAGYMLGHRAQAGGQVQAYPPSFNVMQTCFSEDIEIKFEPDQVLGALARNSWPTTAVIDFHPNLAKKLNFPHPDGVQRLMGSLYAHAFMMYFEKSRAAIELKHGKASNWPNTLTFARIVRNAFAHGGTINILDGASATWRKLSYSPSENGRQVLYNDLTQGDLTLLMLDMDQEF